MHLGCRRARPHAAAGPRPPGFAALFNTVWGRRRGNPPGSSAPAPAVGRWRRPRPPTGLAGARCWEGPVTATTVPGRHSLTSRNLPPLYRRRGVSLFAARQRIFYVQHAAGYFQPAQAGAGILADFEHRASNSPQAGGIRSGDCRPCSRPSRPSSRRGCAKAGEHLPPRNSHQQSLAAANTASQHFTPSAVHSLNQGFKFGAVVKSTQPSPNRPRAPVGARRHPPRAGPSC